MFRWHKIWIKHLTTSPTIWRSLSASLGERDKYDAYFIMRFAGESKPASTAWSKPSTALSCLKPNGIRSPYWASARLPAIPLDQRRTRQEMAHRKTCISERNTEADMVSPAALAASRKRHSILADKPKMKATTVGMSVTANSRQLESISMTYGRNSSQLLIL